MERTINNVYILTSAELLVLAAGKGLDGIFCLDNSVTEPDETEVCKAMNHLYQQGILQNADDGAFVLNEDMQDIMTAVSQAQTMVLVRSFTRIPTLKVIYIGRTLAAAEQLTTGEDAFRLYSIPEEELMDFLVDDVSGKGRGYRPVLDEDNVLDIILNSGDILQQRELDKLGNVLALFEAASRDTGKVKRRIVWMQGSEAQKIYDYGPEKKTKEISGKQEILQAVMGMIQEVLIYDFS